MRCTTCSAWVSELIQGWCLCRKCYNKKFHITKQKKLESFQESFHTVSNKVCP